jgi:hypothetical protein
MTDKFTWRDMKRVVNKMPESRLDDQVVIWDMESDGRALKVEQVEILKEDYHDDGDVGTWKKSDMRAGLDATDSEDSFPVIYPKGTRIINA